MQTFWQDVRYGLRVLARSPGFATVAVLSLALGIGANSTIFSWINSALLNPLPGVADTDELVVFALRSQRGVFSSVSYPDYVDFRDRNTTLAGLILHEDTAVSLRADGHSERIWAELVSGNYFEVLGVKPMLGRHFLPEEDSVPGEAAVTVLSYGFWQQRFGGDPDIVGRKITLNNHPFTTVGVAPPDFQGTAVGLSYDVWIPVMMDEALRGRSNRLTYRGRQWISCLGRLKPGISLAQAEAELNSISLQLSKEYPDTHSESAVALFPLWRSPEGAAEILGPVLLALMGVVGIVLLITCVNVSNLLLARATGRRKEIAIRLSLGAGRWRLLRQLLSESLLLALLGGAAGLLMTVWTSKLLLLFVPPTDAPVNPQLGVDGHVLLFSVAVSLLTGLLFGLAPAWQATRTDLVATLKDETAGRSGGHGRQRLRGALVVAQVTLSVMLLVCAGLFVRSLQKAQTVNPGFNPQNVLLESVDVNLAGYDSTRGRLFYRQLLDRLGRLPGVESVSLGYRVPLGFGGRSTTSIVVEGYEPATDEDVFAHHNSVSPNYFRTMQIPVLQGREFNERDSADAPLVAIVNQTMAERYWKGLRPVGKRIRLGNTPVTVVGVVGDIRYNTLNERPVPFMYLPFQQFYASRATVHLRGHENPARLASTVREEIQSVDASVPVFNTTTLDRHIQASSFQHRLAGNLLGAFGLLALLLAGVGIYGVLAYAVGQRTHEIGVRMALGAQRRDVLRMILRQGATLLGLGVVIGLAASFALARLMSSLLFGVSPHDPVAFAGTPLLLALVALLACYLPARRATRIDPMVALRYE